MVTKTNREKMARLNELQQWIPRPRETHGLPLH